MKSVQILNIMWNSVIVFKVSFILK